MSETVRDAIGALIRQHWLQFQTVNVDDAMRGTVADELEASKKWPLDTKDVEGDLQPAGARLTAASRIGGNGKSLPQSVCNARSTMNNSIG